MDLERRSDSGLFKAATALGLGSVAAKGIGVATMPLLTRLYTPEQFGALAIYSALVSILSPIMSGQYVTAIPAPRSEFVAKRLVSLSVMMAAISGFLAMFLVLVALVATGSSKTSLPMWLFLLVPIGAFGAALYDVGVMWCVRQKDFRSIAETQIIQSSAGEAVKLASTLVFTQASGLILGHLVGVSAGAIKLLRRNAFSLRAITKYKPRKLWAAASLYSEFPKFRVPSTLLMVAAAQAPVLMITAIYGAGKAGQFGLAMMLLVVPMNLVGQAVSKAFYGAIAEAGRKNFSAIYRLAVRTQRSLFAVALPATIVIMIGAEGTFSVVFGEGWRPAGRLAAILAPFVLVQLTSAPLMQIFNLIRSQRVFLVINSSRLAMMGLLFLAARTIKMDLYIFATILSGLLFLFYAGTSVYVIAFTRKLSMST
jgi:O-antigen/teichoic acid export membrane protein